MSHTKKELRAAMRTAATHGPEAAERIAERIEAMDAFRRARTVALYSALSDEVPLGALLGRWLGVKRIVMPVVESDEMVFREYAGSGEMRRGAFGIMEPAGGEIVPPSQIDFIAVPGVAFSRCCQRLGRGKGFYDRYLPLTRAFKVGICFAPRLVEVIACDPHDVDMDAVVTPDAVYYKESK